MIPQLQLRHYRVAENRSIGEGLFELILEATSAEEALPPFQAGQWVYLHLLNPDGTTWARAAYSIASAPSVGTQRIALGIKVEGGFTRRAQQLVEGDVVQLQGPWGVFILPPGDAPLVLFAGGIGVTPLLCMIREAVALQPSRNIHLFYSLRTPAEAAYLDELREITAASPQVKLTSLVTREVPADWEGERGRIDALLLDRVLGQAPVSTIYLLCGPDPFMLAIRELLTARGVEKAQIKQESFG